MRALERQPSPQRRFVIDLAETPTVPPGTVPAVWTQGSSMATASPPMPWAPLAGPLTTQGLHATHGARRQAHSPRPYSVARHAVAAVASHRPGVASPVARPCHSLQSPRRLQPQEVYEMQHPRSPRQPDAMAAARRFQPVVVAPPRTERAERPPLPPTPAVEVTRTPNVPPLAQGPSTLVPGTELQVGYMRLRCEEMLGSGSYSTVWLANVVSQRQEQQQPNLHSVALKDVFCRGEAALQQSLFEVQLLMAVERRMSRAKESKEPQPPPRLPKCLTYQVDPSDEGWSVRMALTRLKGEQLDGWLQRSCEISEDSMLKRPWKEQLYSGCILARHLLQQLGPTLQNLAPLAWHRDVNSHNVLICNEDSEDGTLHAKGQEEKASFWLCDLGLAVDSQSWTGEESLWRTTDIGGDCRYWPASCWMVHCFGADYLEERPNLCRQYQSRLDIHALGITAIEILCTGALALRTAGAPTGEGQADCWSELLDAWKEYHETVSDWWQAIYSVFSCGGDFRPVHAWLVEIGAPDKILGLVGSMRKALNACADVSTSSIASLFRAVAEAIHEDSTMDLLEICKMASVASEPERVTKIGSGPMQSSISVQSVKSIEPFPSSMGAADMAAGTQEPLPGVTSEDEKNLKRSEIHREASAPPATGRSVNRSTQLLKTKLEEEHSRLSLDLQKLQKHRSRVVLAKTLLQQLPA